VIKIDLYLKGTSTSNEAPRRTELNRGCVESTTISPHQNPVRSTPSNLASLALVAACLNCWTMIDGSSTAVG
jgi:hypothetical protein